MPDLSDAPTICQLVHGLPVGGAEVLVSRMIRTLSGRYRFVVACLDEIGELGENLAQDGIEVQCIGRRPGFDWKCARELRRTFHRRSVDIVHAHQYTPFAYALAARAFGSRPPLLLTEHGRFFPDYPSRKRKLFNRLLTTSRDRFVAVGNSVRRAVIDNDGFPADRVEVIYNGAHLPRRTADSPSREAVRRQLEVTAEQRIVLHVARLDPIKDHSTALRAIAAATRRNPDLRMFIVGDGPQKEAIEQAIRERHLGRYVKMLGLRQDVPDLLAAADILLLTSVSEGIPVTVLEAMSARVPVVATNVGGLPELVIHGKTGFLAASGDDQGLADALLRLAENSELCDELAQQAKKRLESEFSEAKMMAGYDRIYVEMLSSTQSVGSHSARWEGKPHTKVPASNEVEDSTTVGGAALPS